MSMVGGWIRKFRVNFISRGSEDRNYINHLRIVTCKSSNRIINENIEHSNAQLKLKAAISDQKTNRQMDYYYMPKLA